MHAHKPVVKLLGVIPRPRSMCLPLGGLTCVNHMLSRRVRRGRDGSGSRGRDKGLRRTMGDVRWGKRRRCTTLGWQLRRRTAGLESRGNKQQRRIDTNVSGVSQWTFPSVTNLVLLVRLLTRSFDEMFAIVLDRTHFRVRPFRACADLQHQAMCARTSPQRL